MAKSNDDILKTSGNNLHIRVARLLNKLGWTISLSEDYIDDQTGKRRESDIIAYKKILITSPDKRKDVLDSFYVYLIVECKHFTEDVAFRMFKAEGQIKSQVKSAVTTNDKFCKEYPQT